MKFGMRAISVGLVLALVACGGDVGDESSNASVDGGTDAEVGDDADTDASTDAGEDVSSFECEEFPAAQIAGTDQTDELADSPARCGQPDHSWLDGTAVGHVVEVGADEEFSKGLIEGFLATQDVEPPREIAHDAQVLTYEYTTQDRGEGVTATSMLAYPQDVEAHESPPEVLLFLHGTTGFTDECAASGDGAYKGLAALFASMGYFVVAPDFIGLHGMDEQTGFLHPYLVGQSTAIASLDAVRAAADLAAEERGELCVSSRVLPIGGSQGGHAALWVDRLAPYYARELEMLGAVATVPPADMLAQMERAVDQLVDASGNTVAFLGSTAGWYGYGDDLDEVFAPPLDEEVPETLGSTCDFSDVVDEPESTADIFTQELIDAGRAGEMADFEPWGCITAENGLTTTSIDRIDPESDSHGTMFVLGEDDDLVHTPIEREAFDELCDQGMPMQYLECAGASHEDATLYGLPEILDFVDARRAGEVFEGDDICDRSEPVECRGTP